MSEENIEDKIDEELDWETRQNSISFLKHCVGK